jgi:hypothetical protein
VENLVGFAAGAAVDALFSEIPLYASTNVWLRVTNPLNPRFAVPSFVTTFAVSKGAIKLFGKGFDYKGLGFDGLAAAVAGKAASDYCEVLVAQLPNRLVFTRPNYLVRPYLFETIQKGLDSLFADDIGAKYHMFLGNAVRVSDLLKDPSVRSVVQGHNKQGEVLKALNETTQIVDAKAYESLSVQVHSAQEKDDESLRQRSGSEGQNLAMSQAAARLTASQIQEDRRRQEAQENVSKTDPNSRVPGMPPQPSPPPMPANRTYAPCPAGSPCPIIISTPNK